MRTTSLTVYGSGDFDCITEDRRLALMALYRKIVEKCEGSDDSMVLWELFEAGFEFDGEVSVPIQKVSPITNYTPFNGEFHLRSWFAATGTVELKFKILLADDTSHWNMMFLHKGSAYQVPFEDGVYEIVGYAVLGERDKQDIISPILRVRGMDSIWFDITLHELSELFRIEGVSHQKWADENPVEAEKRLLTLLVSNRENLPVTARQACERLSCRLSDPEAYDALRRIIPGYRKPEVHFRMSSTIKPD